uniref:Serine/threonine-protein kinase CTR1 n=1 Tax=Anthurium amnicola TaxID=1678845 RepID=A0A1D1Y455_9ARAE
MAIDQNAVPMDLRPLNLSRAPAPAPAPVPASSDLLLAHHPPGTGSPGSLPQYYAAVDPLAAAWPTVVYPQHPPQLVPNGFPEQAVASRAAAAGAATSSDGPDEPQRTSSSRKVKFLCSFGGRILPRPSDGALRYVGGHTRIIAVRKDASFQELMQKMSETYGGGAVLKYQLPDEDLDALVTVSCPEDLENMMEEYDKLAEGSAEGSAKLRVFLFSPTEPDVSGLNLVSDVGDTGQSYVDAVNGVPEKEVAGIKRKESGASLSSTQTSDGIPAELLEGANDGGVASAIAQPTVAVPGTATSMESTRPLHPDTPSNVVFSVPATTTVPVNVPGCAGIPSLQTLQSSRLEQPPPPSAGTTYAYIDPLQGGFNTVDYLHNPSQTQFLNPQQLGAHVSFVATPHHSYLPAVHMTSAIPAAQVSGGMPVRARVEPYLDDGSCGGRTTQVAGNATYKPFQALSQFPPLRPSLLQPPSAERYGLSPVPPPGVPPVQTLRFEDCNLCQRALPHVHSETLMQEHGGSISNKSPAFYSLHSEEVARPHFSIRVGDGAMPDTASMHQPEGSIAPSHLGGYGYSQAAESQQLTEAVHHDAENLGKNTVLHPQLLGFAGSMQAPYGVYLSNHTQAWHEGISQQQQPPIAPSQYLLKQGPMINNTVGTNITSSRNETAQNSELHSRGPRVEFSYDHTKPVEVMMDSSHLNHFHGSGSNEHQIPAAEPNVSDSSSFEGKIEALRVSVSPSETSGIVNPWKAATNTNVNTQDEQKTENSPLVLDVENLKPNIIETDALLPDAFVNPGKTAETNSLKLVDLLPSSTSEVTYLHNLQPGDPSHVFLVPGNLDLHSRDPELGAVPPIPHERLLQGPGATAKVTISDRKDEASQIYSGNTFNAVYAPSTGIIPFPLSSMNTQNAHFEDIRDSAPSESFFSNIEPWQIMHNTHLPPPKPRRVSSRDALVPRESCVEKFSGNGGESTAAAQLEEGSYHLPLDSLSKNAGLDTNRIYPMEGTADELIKQELQAVAEGVAASVLQQPVPFPGHLGCENNSHSESSREREVLKEDMDSQSSACLIGHKAEDITIGQSDKPNIGFQIMEDIGRLQIISNSDLEELRELGSGTFGTVYHGKWRGSDVAIKRINDRCFAGKQSEQERLRADFWNEACKLADLHHPNVVAFYGLVLDGPGGTVATVTEYMVNGSLRQALQRNQKALDRRKRLLIAMDVAFGMEYLHGKNIVHFDLKSDNLLVNLRDPQRPICKVGDLGLSKVKCQTLISGGVRGTLPWMAPELLNGSSSLVSEKVDVFSFGIVLWELLTGEEPYADLHYGAIIGGIVSNTLRPPIPESCDPEWRSLMEKCWSSEPPERPSFTEIANILRSMATSVPQKGQVQAQTSGSIQPQK